MLIVQSVILYTVEDHLSQLPGFVAGHPEVMWCRMDAAASHLRLLVEESLDIF